MKIIKTPWKNDFLKLVAESSVSVKITSPFVKANICNDLLSVKKPSTRIELITSLKLSNVHAGAVDLLGLEKIIKAEGIVKNYKKLHSKIYLFDEEKVIVTSGNLTNGGLLNNFEYGLYSEDKDLVAQVVEDFNKLSKDKQTSQIKQGDINTAKKILENIPKSQALPFPDFPLESPDNQEEEVVNLSAEAILASLNGWKKEVFICVNSIPTQYFTLQEAYKFQEYFSNVYPENTRIKDKIRQLLQQLRNIGLLEFLGNGNYKKLWK